MAAVLFALLLTSLAVGYLVVRATWSILGTAFSDPVFAGTVLGVGVAVLWSQYAVGRRVAVAAAGARDLPSDRFPGLHRRTAELADAFGVDPPRLMIADLGAPNAFAVGRRGSSTVVLGTDLFSLLTPAELEAVLAHELAHVRNRDSVLMTAVTSVRKLVTGVVAWVAIVAVTLVAAGVETVARLRDPPGTDIDWNRVATVWVVGASSLALVAVLSVSTALSRYREFAADEAAVEVLGRPDALIRALRKIERAGTPPEWALGPLTTHDREEEPVWDRLSTHPDMDERVDRLRAMAADPDRIDPESGARRIPVR
jgi:heat shock protein HtpX